MHRHLTPYASSRAVPKPPSPPRVWTDIRPPGWRLATGVQAERLIAKAGTLSEDKKSALPCPPPAYS